MANAGPLHDWIEGLPGEGRYSFTRADALAVGTASPAAAEATLRRCRKRGAIVTPRRGFHVIVPPEYRSAGCPPASWFIDDLMAYLGRRYYVALLTSAALHGAGHQQPQSFQVMVDAPEREIHAGRVGIRFHSSKRTADADTIAMQTETGSMIVASPETTAFDLVRFPAAAGYWNTIATVLSELVERLDGQRLSLVAARAARSDIQRLGWLLEQLGEPLLADGLAEVLSHTRSSPTPLNTERKVDKANLDPKWRVLVNDTVEPDL